MKRILTDRQEKILLLRCGLYDGKKYTFKEIGENGMSGYKVTAERIRQIEAKALRKLWNLFSGTQFHKRLLCIVIYSLKTQWLKDEVKRREGLPEYRRNPSWESH